MAYLNNIIIYLNSKKEYKEHIKWVLKKLLNENIPIAIEKCKFSIKKTNFVGFIIELKQISMDPKKIKSIVSWQEPKNIIKLRLFLRFCNYYRRFITQWLTNIEPFTKLTKKNELWKWDNK